MSTVSISEISPIAHELKEALFTNAHFQFCHLTATLFSSSFGVRLSA
jgi:hypothetical protein